MGNSLNRTKVVNKRKEGYTIYIGRGSIWGNPFVIGQDGNRAEVITKYEQYIRGKPELLDQLHLLRGQVLGCFCKPLACHGDILIKILKELYYDA